MCLADITERIFKLYQNPSLGENFFYNVWLEIKIPLTLSNTKGVDRAKTWKPVLITESN